MSLIDVRGIGPKGAEKFVSHGILTAEQLSVQRPEEVTSIMNCSVAVAKELINSARELAFLTVEIYNADDYDVMMKATTRFIKTGSEQIDVMLGGGYRSMSTNGLYGPFSTGKTQLINTAMANAIDAGYDVALVETEPNTFNADRIKQICSARKLKYDGKKIHIVPATKVGTVFAQMKGYVDLQSMAIKENWNLALVAVDSFNAKFRRAFAGREMFPERAQEYGRHIDFLEEMAKKFNAVILLTFQVGVTPDESGEKGDQMKFHIPYYPVGGTLVQHNINTWIGLVQVQGGAKSVDVYEANLSDSSFLPKGACKFNITERGVEDF